MHDHDHVDCCKSNGIMYYNYKFNCKLCQNIFYCNEASVDDPWESISRTDIWQSDIGPTSESVL